LPHVNIEPPSLAPVVKFFALTYLVTWTSWLAAVAISQPAQPASLIRGLLLAFGTAAPALVALVLTASEKGMVGLTAMLSRLFQAGVDFRFYVVAILYLPAVKAAVALSYRFSTGQWPRFGHEGPLVIAVAILLSTPVQAGEEIGWRGYALPRIAARFGLGPAGMVVGLLWGVWHLPLFFVRGADQYGQSLLLFVLAVVAFSIAIAWVYGHTQGSLLMTMLMHSAANQTVGIVPDILRPGEKPFALGGSLSFVLTIAWMWVAAGYFLVRMPAFRSTAEVQQLAISQKITE
jgi:membrane protease YdiL (CAAX protease family)